jgi:RHS repeat-associated protein
MQKNKIRDRKIEHDERYAFAQGGGYKYENGAYYLDAAGSFAQLSASDGIISHYTAELISATDYYAFGAPLPERTWQGGEYRFGFNGQERDDEVAGVGNIMTAEFWEYDARLGRRWNVDPISNISFSDYSTFENNPIYNEDHNGDFPLAAIAGFIKGISRNKSEREFGGSRMKEGFYESVRHMKNSANIIAGLFNTDSRKSFAAQGLQLILRFTWELPQTIYGFGAALGYNILGHIHSVGNISGSTHLYDHHLSESIMIGNVLIGGKKNGLDYDESSQGYQRLSQLLGPTYFLAQVFDGFSNIFSDKHNSISSWALKAGTRIRIKFDRYGTPINLRPSGPNSYIYDGVKEFHGIRKKLIVSRNYRTPTFGEYKDGIFLRGQLKARREN